MEHPRKMIIDLFKGIAIILVIWGHFIQFSSAESYDFYADNVFKFLYSFHMPLFSGISGYLFFDSLKKRTLKQVIESRIKGLLWPVLLWGTIRYVMELILQIYKGEFGLSVSNWWYYIDGMFLWFLLTIFAVSICVSIVVKILPEKFHILGFVLSFFAMYLFPNQEMNLYLYPYFVIGFWAKKKETIWKPYQRRIIFGATIWFLFMLVFYRKEHYIYTSGITLWKSEYGCRTQFGIDIYRYLIGLCGSIAIMGGVYLLNRRLPIKWTETVCSFGRNTMQIYILQTFVFWVWPRVWNKIVAKFAFNLLRPGTFFYWFITLVMALILLEVLKKIYYIKRKPHLHSTLFGRQ